MEEDSSSGVACYSRLLNELIPACKKNKCSDDCCSFLPTPDVCMSNQLWKDTYSQQSNHYRLEFASKCAYPCYTQASVFTNAYPDSPMFMPQCASFHKTTKLNGACKKVIGNYCTKYLMNPPHGGFLDKQLCDDFSVNVSSILKIKNWDVSCDFYFQRLNITGQEIPITCLAYIRSQCKQAPEWCSCNSYEETSSTTFRLVPCPFNTCVLQTTELNVNEYMVICFFFLLFIVYFKAKFS